MARPLRIEFSDAVYHVSCRENAREPVLALGMGLGIFLAVTYIKCVLFGSV